jgi:nitrate/nitrite transporter NarK
VVGLKLAGVPFTLMMLGLLLPLAALAMGWRMALLLLLVLPMANVVLTVRSVPRREKARIPRRPIGGVVPPAPVWWLAAYSLLMGMPIQATNAYMPLFAHEQLGLNLRTAALSMTLAGAVGLLARVALGWLSDLVAAPEYLLVVLALVSSLGSLLVWRAGLRGQPGLFWAGVMTHGLTAVAAIVVTTVVLVRSFDQASIGISSGALAMGQFAGFSAGPVLFGICVDVEGSYAPAWIGCALLYLTACAVAWMWMRTRLRRSVDSKIVVR